MLALAKLRLPEQFLNILIQCQRHPQCMYAACTTQLKSSESSSPLETQLKREELSSAVEPNSCTSDRLLSLSAITDYNFENIHKDPGATDYCKLVLRRLRLSVDELSKHNFEPSLVCSDRAQTFARPFNFTADDVTSPDSHRIQTCVVDNHHFSGPKYAPLVSPVVSCLPSAAEVTVSNSEFSELLESDYSSWPWRNCHFVNILQNNCYNETGVDGNSSHFVSQFLPADSLTLTLNSNQSHHVRSVSNLCKDITPLATVGDYSGKSVMAVQHKDDVGVALLCHFVDRSGLVYGGSLSHQLFFERGCQMLHSKKGETPSDRKKLPNADQLRVVQDYMSENMPRLFTNGHDYSVYTKDMIFENNWFSEKGYTTVGQLMYTVEIAKLRLYVHVRLANVRVQLLKTTTHPESGSVRVRWRVTGISQTRALMFWNFLPFTLFKKRHVETDEPQWLDGFSTFFVDQDGLIYKHKMDRIIPDEDHGIKVKAGVIEKLTGISGAPATS